MEDDHKGLFAVLHRFYDLYKDYMSRKITKTEMAERLKMSRPTLNRIIQQKREQGLI